MSKRNDDNNICESTSPTQIVHNQIRINSFAGSLNCDELRPKLQQALLDDSKRAQLKQIEEKRRLDQVKQDDDDMWLEVDRRAYADRMLREQMEKQVRDERNACNVKILDWQMANKGDSKAAKRNEIEEERRLNAIKMEELKLHDALKKVERKQKQSEYAEECKVSSDVPIIPMSLLSLVVCFRNSLPSLEMLKTNESVVIWITIKWFHNLFKRSWQQPRQKDFPIW